MCAGKRGRTQGQPTFRTWVRTSISGYQSMSKDEVGTPVHSHPLTFHSQSLCPSGYLMHRCDCAAGTPKLCLHQGGWGGSGMDSEPRSGVSRVEGAGLRQTFPGDPWTLPHGQGSAKSGQPSPFRLRVWGEGSVAAPGLWSLSHCSQDTRSQAGVCVMLLRKLQVRVS